jgi:hypothetical protein
MYGYTIADTANESVFNEISQFVENVLHYHKSGSVLHDVDGSIF